ncbi:hypothetical protein QUB40_26365 [Microcoleus sp. AT9_A2]|uniref:hypothetical protein n=1 Tax=Microcoleus sp. AT9_A2 TaxID=2818624 RepID=UPI002FCE9826
MNQGQHGQSQESTTVGVRGNEGGQGFHSHADGSTAFEGAGARLGAQLLELDRENCSEGAGDFNPFGGVLDQLIDDARKQLIKSNECIVWYREEVKEYEEKLKNLVKLKELQEEQYQEMRRQQEVILQQQEQIQQQLKQQQAESSNHSGENLAE